MRPTAGSPAQPAVDQSPLATQRHGFCRNYDVGLVVRRRRGSVKLSRMTEPDRDPRHTFAEAAEAFAQLVQGHPARRVGRSGSGGVGPPLAGRAHQPITDHRGDLPRPTGQPRRRAERGRLLRRDLHHRSGCRGRSRTGGWSGAGRRPSRDYPVTGYRACSALSSEPRIPLITTAAGGTRLRTYLPTRDISNSWCMAWISPLRPTCRLPTTARVAVRGRRGRGRRGRAAGPWPRADPRADRAGTASGRLLGGLRTRSGGLHWAAARRQGRREEGSHTWRRRMI